MGVADRVNRGERSVESERQPLRNYEGKKSRCSLGEGLESKSRVVIFQGAPGGRARSGDRPGGTMVSFDYQ